MRLRTTLVGVFLCIAVVLSGTIYVGFAMHRADVVAQERAEVEQTASVVAGQIDARLDATVDTVALWSETLALTGADRIEQLRSLNTFVHRTKFDRAAIYAADGRLEAIAGSRLTDDQQGALVGSDFSASRFVSEALDGRIYVSDPAEGVTGDDVVRVSVPIRNETNGVVGVFTGSFELARGSLFENVSTVGHPQDRVAIVANGRTVFTESGSVAHPLVANVTVPATGWTISVQRPRATIASELTGATALQIGGVTIGLLAVGIVGLWVSRTTLTRIRELLDALGDLESGEYRTDLDLGSIEEWHRISDRFNAVSRTLEQRDSQLRVLNRVLRHNLRNDMNVISARAERVLADDRTPRAIEEDIQRIQSTASRLITTSEHARTLYDDLLAQPKQAVEPVDVAAIVRERTEQLTSQFPEATIETDLDDAWVLDSAAVPIVVEELVRNAIVHNDLPLPDRRVTVTVTGEHSAAEVDADRETRVEVADNGPGIPMVEEALLTDELEETPIEHGSGLGVWLVNWLVDQIGGTVSVTTGVDRGTTVTMHLPAPATPPADDREPELS